MWENAFEMALWRGTTEYINRKNINYDDVVLDHFLNLHLRIFNLDIVIHIITVFLFKGDGAAAL